MSEFAAPGSMAAFDYEASLGHLLLVIVTGYEEKVSTSLGDKPAIRADILDLDDPDLSAEDALVFPRVLVSTLKSRMGQKVLGRLTQGVAKPGQNAPWMLEDASTDPKAVAKAKAALVSRVSDPIPF